MKYSYSWLEKYFDTPLPEVDVLSERITSRLAEVDGIEKLPNSNYTVIDIKVLPDRAGYLLSHAQMAKEIGAMLGVSAVRNALFDIEKVDVSNTKEYPLLVSSKACQTYTAIEGKVDAVADVVLYDQIKDALASVGQRSINPLVDIANFVMLDIGQPMHVFDAQKLDGSITVRAAEVGEKMITLDERELTLTSADLVIADESSVLGLAGIKGGKKAESTNDTTHFVLESANFNATSIRKSGQRHGIKTDASKRFENSISSYWSVVAAEYALALIKAVYGGITIISYTQFGTPETGTKALSVSTDEVSRFLGVPVSNEQCTSTASVLGWSAEISNDGLLWNVPVWRNDLVIPQDIAEEVGRLIGYETISPIVPEPTASSGGMTRWQFMEILKDELVGLGLFEVQAYTLVPEGELQVLSAPSPQRMKLRTALAPYVAAEAEKNARNGDLLGLDPVMVFEIGSVFTKDGESVRLAIAVSSNRHKAKVVTAKVQDIVTLVQQKIKSLVPNAQIDVPIETKDKTAYVEVVLDGILNEVETYSTPAQPLQVNIHPMEKYQPYSPYPYIVRDIAVLVPTGETDEKIVASIKARAGVLAVRTSLFDVFEKKDTGQTSYGYRIVFQSPEKTLLAEDIDAIMAEISKDMTVAGFVVR
jgi:phenylalanyl-tRNA synthetase beta chain